MPSFIGHLRNHKQLNINWKGDKDLVFTRIDDFNSDERKVRRLAVHLLYPSLLFNHTTNTADLQDNCLPLVTSN